MKSYRDSPNYRISVDQGIYRKGLEKGYQNFMLGKRKRRKDLVGYLFYSNGDVKPFYGSTQHFREITKHLR